MYRPLIACATCQRHVLSTEDTCPFCGSTRRSAAVRVERTARMSRALMLSASVALLGCGGATPKPEPPGDDVTEPEPPDDGGGAVALYGAPAPEPQPDDAGEPGPPDDPGGMVPKYGAPAPPDQK